MLFFTMRNNENEKIDDKASLLPSSVHALPEPTQCFPWNISLYGMIFGLLGKLMVNIFIINMHVKLNSMPVSIVVLAAAITACFWTISGVFGVFCYGFLLQQYNQRQRFLCFFRFMGGCSIGSLLASVICSLLFFGTPAPSSLHLCLDFGYLSLLIILILNTRWIRGCDELKEEEGSLKKKDEGEMTTV